MRLRGITSCLRAAVLAGPGVSSTGLNGPGSLTVFAFALMLAARTVQLFLPVLRNATPTNQTESAPSNKTSMKSKMLSG